MTADWFCRWFARWLVVVVVVWTGLVGDVDSSVCGTILCVGDNRLHDRAKTAFGLYFIWYLLVLNIFLIC